eukprot:m.278302 g.278302  ORF g.278302 m.278302 type:complete len:297 (-) comp19380_c1_seq4:64-954(-)
MAMAMAAARFDAALFSSLLTTRVLGRTLNWFEVSESTMKNASGAVDAACKARRAGTCEGTDPVSALHGTVFLAERQTAGVGRRGRGWESPTGNLYVSFVWCASEYLGPAAGQPVDPGALMQHMTQLNIAMALAVVAACQPYGLACKVKWPNDVWLDQRKLSGMLINLVEPTTAVAGIGIDVNQEMVGQQGLRAISIADAVGQPVGREAVLAAFCNDLEKRMDLPFRMVLQTYEENDMLRGHQVRVHHGSREVAHPSDYDAEVTGFSSKGELLVRNKQTGAIKPLVGEEISLTMLQL